MLKNLISQSLGVISARVAAAGLSVAVSVIIARAWGPAALGLYSYVVAIIALAASPTSNGWSTLILRETARKNQVTDTVEALAKNASYFALTISIAAFVVSYLVLTLLPANDFVRALRPIAIPMALLAGFILYLDQISSIRMAKLRGINRPVLGQIPETIAKPVVLSIAILTTALLMQDSATNVQLFICLAIASLAATLVGESILRKLSNKVAGLKFSPKENRIWLASVGSLALTGGLIQLNGYIDVLILGAHVSPEMVGYYRAALQIAMLGNFGFMALNFLAGQRFSRFIETKDDKNLRRSATYLARLSFITAAPLPILLALFGQIGFAFLFGPGFEVAASAALVLSVGFAVNAAFGMPYTLLVMHHETKIGIVATLIALGVNVLCCTILIPRVGLVGAAIGNAAGLVVWVVFLWAAAKRKLGIDSSFIGYKPKTRS